MLEIISLPASGDAARAAGVRLLLGVADAGRVFKEVLCESGGAGLAAACLAQSRDERTQSMACALLLELGSGSPAHLAALFAALRPLLPSASPGARAGAAQVLRQCLPSLPPDSPAAAELVEPAMTLLDSLDLTVQFEGGEGPKRIKPQNLQVLPPIAPPADIASPPPSTSATAPQRGKKVGRNDKCPCGSRRKYKKCCEAGDLATGGLGENAERGGGGAGTRSRVVTSEMLRLAKDGNMRAVQRLVDDGIDVNSIT